jgi:hypothetical protein
MVEVSRTKNLRNTQYICGTALKYFCGEPVEAVGPEGREVERLQIPTLDNLPPVHLDHLMYVGVTRAKLHAVKSQCTP